MRLTDGKDFSYCMNVHPGEGVADMQEAIRDQVPYIQQALSPEAPFGLGLRVAAEAARELQRPERLSELKQQLAEQNLYAFTINGFPYGAFHQTRVKEKVYLPDWASPERFTYTRQLFFLLAQLLPDHAEGSVSTVPLGYRFAPTRPEETVEPLREMGRVLARLEQETGKTLHLGLEPEPDCLLETTEETIAFFQNDLFRGTGSEEEVLRRHLGVCLDTCHVAMQFEDPAESFRQYRAAGIRVSKVQLSAALECAADIPEAALQPFDDGVYLHQVKSLHQQEGVAPEINRVTDLPEWLGGQKPEGDPLRIHAHVPLHWPGSSPLGTTRHTLSQDFWDELQKDSCPHIEVETYTFDVLPDSLRGGRTVKEDMTEECKWALKKICSKPLTSEESSPTKPLPETENVFITTSLFGDILDLHPFGWADSSVGRAGAF